MQHGFYDFVWEVHVGDDEDGFVGCFCLIPKVLAVGSGLDVRDFEVDFEVNELVFYLIVEEILFLNSVVDVKEGDFSF